MNQFQKDNGEKRFHFPFLLSCSIFLNIYIFCRLVQFCTPWSAGCKKISEAVFDLASSNNKVNVGTVDCGEAPGKLKK